MLRGRVKTQAPSLGVTLDKFYLRHIVLFDSNYGAAAGNTPSFAGNCLPFVLLFLPFLSPPARPNVSDIDAGD